MEKEMLEEVAEKIISDMGWVWENTESSARMVARHCAKSQERSYSEEDMVKFVSFVGRKYIKAKGFYYMKGDFEKSMKVSIHQILEQFKKK